ncbi:complement C1q subcomponent subunit A [Conger conger]|uniref:complement C1q subcomponent subunit A n=1 Tax=Conger conger TaxID=82655 RepID=UPI002A59A732|nr:complement C1q subcomponent subunit A [Conger conger]
MHCLAHMFMVLWLVVLLGLVFCQDTCRVQDGKPGQTGAPGRDGRFGQKGQKGEAAPWMGTDMKTGVKGSRGDRGFPGSMGPKGYRGENGQMGMPGIKGAPGPTGHSGGGLEGQQHSAFSVERTLKNKPNNGVPVTFNTVLADINSDFNIVTGYFTCKTAGVYYFVFHSMSIGNLCLALKSDVLGTESLGFCDFNKNGNTQVLSGGGVLKLSKGEKVWVEPFKEGSNLANHMTNTQSRSIVFNGFLVFSSAD